jgi:hypothetical protein
MPNPENQEKTTTARTSNRKMTKEAWLPMMRKRSQLASLGAVILILTILLLD